MIVDYTSTSYLHRDRDLVRVQKEHACISLFFKQNSIKFHATREGTSTFESSVMTACPAVAYLCPGSNHPEHPYGAPSRSHRSPLGRPSYSQYRATLLSLSASGPATSRKSDGRSRLMFLRRLLTG